MKANLLVLVALLVFTGCKAAEVEIDADLKSIVDVDHFDDLGEHDSGSMITMVDSKFPVGYEFDGEFSWRGGESVDKNREQTILDLLLLATLSYVDGHTIEHTLKDWGFNHFYLIEFHHISQNSSIPQSDPEVSACQFEKYNLKMPTWCDECGKFVISSRAQRCSQCHYTVHEHCKDIAAKKRICPQSTHSPAEDIELLKQSVRHTTLPNFIAVNDKAIVISFRGTEPLNLLQWNQDFMMSLLKVNVKGTDVRIHAGYWAALTAPRLGSKSSIIETMVNIIKNKIDPTTPEPLPIYVTGHSLGGGLTVVCATLLHQYGLSDRVGAIVTFGQPRMGDIALTTLLDQVYPNNFVRVVHGNDIIPRAPLEIPDHVEVKGLIDASLFDRFSMTAKLSLRGYHEPLGVCLWLNGGKLIMYGRSRCPDMNIFEIIAETALTPLRIKQLINSGASFAGIFARFLAPDMVFDHYPIGYISDLQTYLASDEEVLESSSYVHKISLKTAL